ncbi:uncharacterized protein LOC101853423 [Aplysia californica]|uniref:Uncharacterized protein LOC101853423 n=1 Tax=Aplysia californica TaxID=6500 RepID=A0ABM0JBN6_APLCA|nr:uncharacterized protein LOC101853423 [Aplysia californica]
MMRLKRDDSSDSLLNNGPRSEYVKRYPEHPVNRTKSYKPPAEIVKGEGQIDSLTIQRRDFPEHPLQKRQPYKRDSDRPDLGAFEGHPSYREDYPEWQLPEKRPREKANWQRPEQPFEGKSTNMNDFPEHQISPRVNYRPDNKPLQSEKPFEDRTGYKDTFKEHPLPPKQPRQKVEWTKPVDPFDATTTQQKDFQGLYQPKQKSLRPDQAPVTSDAPIEKDTTTSVSYPPHALPTRFRHEPEQYRRPDGDMDLNTTAGMYYKEHAVERQAIQKPGSSHLLRGRGQMEKDTNYATDYPEHPMGRRELMKPKNNYVPPSEPISSVTVNQADYHPHKLGPRRNFKPNDAPMQSDKPFDDRTGYRDTFKEHKISPRQQREKEVYTGPTAPLDARTTVGESYLGPYQPKRDSFRPDRNPVQSDQPFDDSTTMNHDFKAYEVQKRQGRKQAEYQRPLGDMDLNTTHNTNFKELPLHKQAIQKPGSSHLLRGSGLMSNSTNYQGDFVEKPIEKRKLLKPDADYHPPTDPMDSRTTHQEAYIEKYGGKRETFRPKNDPLRSDVPFEDRTENRDTFVPHEVNPRKLREKEAYLPPTAKLEDRTTVRDSYQGSYQPKRESFRPDRNPVLSDAPFDDTTTTGTSFKEVQIPDRFVRKHEVYQKPDGYMDMTTTNFANYKEHRAEKQPIVKPGSSHLLRGSGEMSKDTNYSNHFQQPPPVKRELVRRRDEYKPPSMPLESTTTTHGAYKEHGLTPRKNFKPKGDYLKSDAPFDDSTDYRDRFTQHQLPPRHVMQREEHKPPSAPFDSRTTAHDSYLGAYQAKRESFRPDREVVQSNVPFQSDTTFGASFKPYETQQRHRHKPAEYVKPEGNMDLTTINRETYKEVRGERPAMRKLGDSSLLSHAGKFEDRTSYGSEFVPKSNENRKLLKPDNQYIPSSVPFDDHTTYRTSHVGYVAPKERSRRPDALSDVLGQRDGANPFHIKQKDWRSLLNMPKTETASA